MDYKNIKHLARIRFSSIEQENIVDDMLHQGWIILAVSGNFDVLLGADNLVYREYEEDLKEKRHK